MLVLTADPRLSDLIVLIWCSTSIVQIIYIPGELS